MGAIEARSFALRGNGIAQRVRWLQAGFSSFAYRLAHLTSPRSATICAVALAFYLG